MDAPTPGPGDSPPEGLLAALNERLRRVPDRVLAWVDRARASYIFIPSTFVFLALFVAVITTFIDGLITDRPPDIGDATSASSARTALSVIAGSVVTMTSIALSITIVTLQLASQQYGPRLIRSFMQDTVTQVVIGVFVGAFVYCLIVLKTIRDGEGGVPHLSMTLAVILAVVSLLALIVFLQNIARAIHADHIIARIADSFDSTVVRIYPERDSKTPNPDPPDVAADAPTIVSNRRGYLTLIDRDRLVEIARHHDLRLRALYRTGDFVTPGDRLLAVDPDIPEDTESRLRSAFFVGRQRTSTQDVEFAMHQLVDIAGRALSPGINDPRTAMSCVDRIGASFQKLAERDRAPRAAVDSDDVPRLRWDPPQFPQLLRTAFVPLRQFASTNVAVTIRLLEVLERIARRADRTADVDEIARQADTILATAEREVEDDVDLEDVRSAHDRCERTIEERREAIKAQNGNA